MPSKRHFSEDVDKARRRAYREMEDAGDAQKALWSMAEALQAAGIDIGPKAEALLERRKRVKRRAPRRK